VIDEINCYSKKLEKDNNITLKLYGLSYAGRDKVYDGKIHEIDLMYGTEKRMHYKEARKLFYSVVDGLLEKINKNEKLSRYFYHTPVSYQDLRFNLSFDYSDKGILKKDDVSMIYIFENRISYLIVEKLDERPADRYRRADLEIEHMLTTTRAIDRNLPEGPEADSD
jgi:hypothetical protein